MVNFHLTPLAKYVNLFIFQRIAIVHKSIKYRYTVNSTVSGHRQFRVNCRKRYLFFPNGIEFRYFDYPVIFSNLLDAWNVMLAVETWLIEVLITKCLTAPLHGKVKEAANYLHVTAKTSTGSRNFSKTCIIYIYIFR